MQDNVRKDNEPMNTEVWQEWMCKALQGLMSKVTTDMRL